MSQQENRTCSEHSGVTAKFSAVEDDIRELKKDVKDISSKLNKWGGIIAGIAAIPLIMKLVEVFTPKANAQDMDFLVEPGLIGRLFESFSDKQYGVFVGAVLLVLVAAVRKLFNGKFSKNASDWISASSALVAGVAAGLLAGGVWYETIVIGLFASAASSGFWEKVRGLIPPSASMIFFCFAVSGFSSGCGAFQGGHPSSRCNLEQGLVDGIQDFTEEVRGSVDSIEFDRAIDLMDKSLVVAQSAVDACVATRDRSDAWGWVRVVMGSMASVLGLVKSSGVQVPDSVTNIMDISNALLGVIQRGGPK